MIQMTLTFILLTLICALISCAKFETMSPPVGPVSVEVPVFEISKDTNAPLKSSPCEESTTTCSSYSLSLSANVANSYLSEKREAHKVLNEAVPNVLSAKWNADQLNINISIPNESQESEFHFVLPAVGTEDESVLKTVTQTVISALNESSSSEIHVYARQIKVKKGRPRISVVASKISEEDKKLVKSMNELPSAIAKVESRFGARNFRGAYQEVTLVKTEVPLDYFNDAVVADLKSVLKFLDKKEFFSEAEANYSHPVYFQNGELKSPRENHQNKLNESEDYCIVNAGMKFSKDKKSTLLEGTVTLVTGDAQFGPVSTQGPTPDFSQSIALGNPNFVAGNRGPKTGFNKNGNGRKDNGRIISIRCKSKNPASITVHTLVKAVGSSRIQIAYPRANTLEAHLDSKKGFDATETVD